MPFPRMPPLGLVGVARRLRVCGFGVVGRGMRRRDRRGGSRQYVSSGRVVRSKSGCAGLLMLERVAACALSKRRPSLL